MSRLVLVDTADQLPGLLPLHAWSALMSTELVVIGSDDHPFLPHLQAADLRVEVIPEVGTKTALTRGDLLSGLSPQDKGRAEWVVDRARELGEVVYLFGPRDIEAFTRTLGMEAARSGTEVEVVYFGVAPKGLALLDLVRVEERLRSPDGCPWDLEQDHGSLAPYAVEETYELLEAIAEGDDHDLREELGDVLLQVVFHAQVAEDREAFTIDDVARGIADKLVRRHPHVFGDAVAADADAVRANWEQLKAEEKPERTGPFDGVPTSQPAVPYATKLQSRAAKLGFEWAGDGDATERMRAALDALRDAPDDASRAERIGELLMGAVGVARREKVDPEMALRSAAARFRSRFEAAVAAAGTEDPRALTRERWLQLWDEARDAEDAEVPAGVPRTPADPGDLPDPADHPG